jgi:hypothetical protein
MPRLIYTSDQIRADIRAMRAHLDRIETELCVPIPTPEYLRGLGYSGNSLPDSVNGGTSDPRPVSALLRRETAYEHAVENRNKIIGEVWVIGRRLEDVMRLLPAPERAGEPHRDKAIDIWCSACAKVDDAHEPQAIHADLVKEFGAKVADHARLMRWCRWHAAWWKNHEAEPPARFVRKHLGGKRITQQEVDEWEKNRAKN